MNSSMTMDELKKLFEEALERAPHKTNFCEDLATLPGVACFHGDLAFCQGYLKSLLDNKLAQPDGYEILSYYKNGIERNFLLKDAASFIAACLAMKNRAKKETKTSRKVLVRMVQSRIEKSLKLFEKWSKGRWAQIQTLNWKPPHTNAPVLSSKNAISIWMDISPNKKYISKLGKLCGDYWFLDVLSREDITDDIFAEAWNLASVKEVMES